MTSRKDLSRLRLRDVASGMAACSDISTAPAMPLVIDPTPVLSRSVSARAENLQDSAAKGAPLPHSEARHGLTLSRAPASIPGAPAATTQRPNAGRGVVIYIALSLTPDQAAWATAWALAADCTVNFLIRRVAQSVRKAMVADWSAGQFDTVDRARQTHPSAPTSVTLTLPAPLAQSLQAALDPFGLLGLSRAIAPAFRSRFEAAFDAACDRAGF